MLDWMVKNASTINNLCGSFNATLSNFSHISILICY